jgi:signal transduction histidine kinase
MGALASRVEALGVWGLLAGETLAIVAGGLGLALAALASAARLYVDAEGALQNRLGLGRLVKEQEAQLRDKQAALEAEIAKRAVLEERERFSRDIHDGVGGSLVTLLMQARVGKLKEDDLAPALERALEDLRLMVDALDHSRSSLAAAFSTFQTRVSPAFAAAGIDLDWRQGALPEGALAGPGELIQVFRILQEACANVLKHSRATRAHVRIGWNAAAERFELDIEDDGSAAASNSAPGHGLRNMTQRAEKIGGALSIEPQAPGWAVRLRVPA